MKYYLTITLPVELGSVPTAPSQSTPYLVPHMQPQATPGLVPQAVPQPMAQHHPQMTVPAFQPTYTSFGGYAPVSPSQVGQLTPELTYVTPPPMLPHSTPMAIPSKVDEDLSEIQREATLVAEQTYHNEFAKAYQESREQWANETREPDVDDYDKALKKAQLKATAKAQHAYSITVGERIASLPKKKI